VTRTKIRSPRNPCAESAEQLSLFLRGFILTITGRPDPQEEGRREGNFHVEKKWELFLEKNKQKHN